jgi:hypothetical protein
VTLRHIVLMSFPDGRDEDFITRMTEGVAAMARAIPDIQAATCGPDVSGQDENYDYALVLDFTDRAAYGRYRVHAAHQAFIAAFMRGRTIEKVRVQYEFGQGS